jgi:xanthine/CO dehydrogenase XdhC/CoxF family maturation factor
MKQELVAMIALAKRLLASGTPGTLTTLFSACGSTYRPLGSMMVSLPGAHAGSVSGGCLEEYVARAGERATRNLPAVMLHFSTHPDADDDIPILGCGGSIDLLVERLVPQHLTLLEQLATAHDRAACSLLACTLERSQESIAVTREWLPDDPDPLDGRPELARIRQAVVGDGKSRHATLGSKTELLVQYVQALTRLLIFGAGDDVRPLCDIGASLGWHVSVVDRRARLATPTRFPNADVVLAADWDEAVDALRFTPSTAVVLMTHSLADDARVLSLLPTSQVSYIGALGPAHRRQWLLKEVAAGGVRLTHDFAARVRGPIGLDLGDRSAAGIAVSVAAEILAALNARDARSLYMTTAPAAVERRPTECRACA